MQDAPAPSPTEAYLARLPPDQRAALEDLRRQILSAAPDAVECFSYGLPGFKRHGVLVWIGAGRNHCALYPHGEVETFADQLRDYQTSKGAIRFQPDKPLPPALVQAIVARRIEQDIEAAAARPKRR